MLSQLSYTPIWRLLGSFLSLFPRLLFLGRLGLSGLEPPTSRLSGVRSNRLSYKPIGFLPSSFLKVSGSHLLSHTVSSAVPSAAWGLTGVFGMGTGVSPKRIATGMLYSPVRFVLRIRHRNVFLSGAIRGEFIHLRITATGRMFFCLGLSVPWALNT